MPISYVYRGGSVRFSFALVAVCIRLHRVLLLFVWALPFLVINS